jgi:tetratricopeptide (TPR) repeat protein
VGEDILADDARQLIELANVNPAQAWRQASELARRASRAGDHAIASVAGRAAGLAALHISNTDLDTATRYLRQAVDSARRAGSARLMGEARMTLAFALTRRGDVRRALRTIESALTDLAGVERARATAQRGAIRQQLGHLDEALVDYRNALPVLRRSADWTWVQRIHSNRGVLFIYRSQLAVAASELAEAERVCRDHDLDLQLAFVLENIAFLHIRKGDVPTALHWLDAAERAQTSLRANAGTVLMDRAELLLSVGLVKEARGAARGAVEELGRMRRRISLPQAQLLLAETALLDGDVAAAQAAAETAIRAFRAQRRTEWVALARYTSLRCRLRRGNRVTVRDLTRAAADLDAAGWSVPALDARLIGAGIALDEGDAAGAEELLRKFNAVRRRGPAELRARAWHAEALRRLADGRGRAAARALRAGIQVLEEHQATLPAADLRSTVSSHRADLVALGTRLALDGGKPTQALLWAERGRATALRVRPIRPPDDPVVAQLLVELRATAAAIDEARAAKRPHESLLSRQSGLERAVRDQVRATAGPMTADRRPSAAEVGAALREAALIEYVEQDGTLYALTVVGPRVRMIDLGSAPELPALLEQLPFALRRLARRSPTGRDGEGAGAALRLLQRACQRLDEMLLVPLAREIGDRPLVIVPFGPLRSVLWSALPSCAARPVTVAPSAAHWYQAERAPARPRRAVIAAGPDLAAAPAEAAAVAKLYDNPRVLIGPAATVNAVKSALAGSGVAHIAAHGRLRSDNPLFSSLRMYDGPLTVYDLDTMREAPTVVVLAACDGGTSHTLFGDEVLGLAAGFLARGTTALVGPLGLVRDGAMEELMVELHKGLSAGRTPADALLGVRRAAAEGSPAQRAAAASLVCLGAGHTPALTS